ncbi:MAG: hypothetical protein ACXACK_10725 [Candidatus Hodarchaeales archaeon]|jgi:hypothetical protein
MVRLKAVYLITDEGFSIYNQSFGATEQDQDMVASLIMALTTFSKEVIDQRSLSKVGFGGGEGGADMIMEQGKRLIAIAVVVLDKEHKEREEYDIRKELLQFVREIEDIYDEELDNPIFRKSAFSGVGTLIFSYFFRDKMSRIYKDQFASFNEYSKYPTSLLFEISPQGGKIYSFYRGFPKFDELVGDISKDDFDLLIADMLDKYSMISFQDCLDRFGTERGEQILKLFKFLTTRGMFEAYNFERIATSSVS